jgi:hypothetical protein
MELLILFLVANLAIGFWSRDRARLPHAVVVAVGVAVLAIGFLARRFI